MQEHSRQTCFLIPPFIRIANTAGKPSSLKVKAIFCTWDSSGQKSQMFFVQSKRISEFSAALLWKTELQTEKQSYTYRVYPSERQRGFVNRSVQHFGSSAVTSVILTLFSTTNKLTPPLVVHSELRAVRKHSWFQTAQPKKFPFSDSEKRFTATMTGNLKQPFPFLTGRLGIALVTFMWSI